MYTVLYFENKFSPDHDSVFDRLAIVVSGNGVEKFLEISKLMTSTCELIGNKLIELVYKWSNVSEWLAALCFDTTASNTGFHSSVISLIQRTLALRAVISCVLLSHTCTCICRQ